MSRYKRFLRLVETWPKNPAKGEIDLQHFLEEKVKAAFSRRGNDAFNSRECEDKFNALSDIATNKALKKYPLPKEHLVPVTGMNLEELVSVNSVEAKTLSDSSVSARVKKAVIGDPKYMRHKKDDEK